MPRRFRLPEGMLRRLLLAAGILFPFALYTFLRAVPQTRPSVLAFEAQTARITTRAGEAFRYVFLRKDFEENELTLCQEERRALTEELATLRASNVGPMRILPVQVIARSYAGDDHKVLIWKEEGDPFVVGEGVGTGKILLGIIVEAKNDLAVVRTLTHSESAIPAMVSGKEETVGILSGTTGAWMEFSYVPKGSAVAVGDTLVTSGLGGGIVRDLVLGTVREIIDADPSPFYRIKVEPAIYSNAWWEADVFHLPSL